MLLIMYISNLSMNIYYYSELGYSKFNKVISIIISLLRFNKYSKFSSCLALISTLLPPFIIRPLKISFRH